MRSRHQAKFRKAEQGMICAVCGMVIHRGRGYVQGLTREPYHPECRRLRSALLGSLSGPSATGPVSSALPPPSCAYCGDRIDGKPVRKDGQQYCVGCYRAVVMT